MPASFYTIAISLLSFYSIYFQYKNISDKKTAEKLGDISGHV